MQARPVKEKRLRRTALCAAAASNAIFGFSFMFSRIALRELNPESLLMLRFLGAFALVNILTLIVSRRKNTPDWLRFDMRGKPLLPLLCLGMLQPILYFILETNGVRLTNSSVTGVFIATIPICAMALGFVFLKEKVRPAQVLFAFVSIVGIVMLTVGQTGSGAIRPLGIVCLIGAVLSGAMFNIISRRVSVRYTPLECTYVMMGMGAVFFTAMALYKGADLSAAVKWSVLFSVSYLSVFSSFAAFLLLNFANSVLPVAQTTSFCNLTTVLSLFAGVVFLDEPFGGVSLLAAALILTGIIGVQKSAKE